MTVKRDADTDVRIVDIKLPFMTVFRFAFQLWLSLFLISLAVWLLIMLFFFLLGALGVGLSGLGGF